MTHAEMDELYDLYPLGALEPELAVEIDEHLAQQCPYCTEHVGEADRFTAAMAGIAESKQPPSRLRGRVLASVGVPSGPSPKRWAAAVGALIAACVALLIVALVWKSESGGLRRQVASLRSEVAALENQAAAAATERTQAIALRTERDRLRAALDIVSGPATRSVAFGNPNTTPQGRVFVNNQGRLVLVAARLPRLPGNRTFELWVMPRTGNPRPAGLFRPTATGDSVHISSAPAYPATTKAVAVSIEPREGSAAPTTTPIIVVPLQ